MGLGSEDNSSQSTLIRTVEATLDGLKKWTVNPNGTISSETVRSVNADGLPVLTTKTVTPDGSYEINVQTGVSPTSTSSYDADDNLISKTSFEYDAHGRRDKIIDIRNGEIKYTYNDDDTVDTVTSPDPDGEGERVQQMTQTIYNDRGQIKKLIQPDNSEVHYEYYDDGLVKNHGDPVFSQENLLMKITS